MTVYTWKGVEHAADQHRESHISYELPPIEWFSRLYPDITTGMKLEGVADLARIRVELHSALEDSLRALAPLGGSRTEIVLEVLNADCNLYRMDYLDIGIAVCQIGGASKG